MLYQMDGFTKYKRTSLVYNGFLTSRGLDYKPVRSFPKIGNLAVRSALFSSIRVGHEWFAFSLFFHRMKAPISLVHISVHPPLHCQAVRIQKVKLVSGLQDF